MLSFGVELLDRYLIIYYFRKCSNLCKFEVFIVVFVLLMISYCCCCVVYIITYGQQQAEQQQQQEWE